MTIKLLNRGCFWAWELYVDDEMDCRSGYWFHNPKDAFEACEKHIHSMAA